VLLGESRWPPAIALIAFIALNIALRVWLPNEGAVRVVWLLPAIESVLLVVLVAGDPARLASRGRWVRPLLVGLVCLLVLAALWATVLLVYDLVKGIGVTTLRRSSLPPAASSGSETTSRSPCSTG
jgi:hypothetical protein